MFEMIPGIVEHVQLMLHPIYISEMTILQPWPAEESRLKVIFRPFDRWVSKNLLFLSFKIFIFKSEACNGII